jgi:pimeloyl-ACP methyl ester carboxylesterase
MTSLKFVTLTDFLKGYRLNKNLMKEVATMKRFMQYIFLIFLSVSCILKVPSNVEANDCIQGTQNNGAIYLICIPPVWNGELVVFAHGYVAPVEPLGIPEDQLYLPDGTSIPEIVNGLGYAFATTSYRKNGLAVVEGVEDILDLVDIFKENYLEPRHIYLVGASEGGLVTTLAVENYPDVFSGGLALCGPIGDFQRQVNYWGDFRVIFDYFFPNVLPPTPISIPEYVLNDWDSYYQYTIQQAIISNPHNTNQLLKVTKAPTDPYDNDSVLETVLGLLWYNVFATNEAIVELNGQPFDNKKRWYYGSDNDLKLNFKVQRFKADQSAIDEIKRNYQTSGMLRIPLVTMHTTGDPIVPYWHENLYWYKTLLNGSGLLHTNIPVFRYGHCNFKTSEALAGFILLVLKVTGHDIFEAETLLNDINAKREFWDMLEKYGSAY